MGTDLATATPGVEQKRPKLMPGVENVEWLLATTTSHMATSWQPAAAATPSTCLQKRCFHVKAKC